MPTLLKFGQQMTARRAFQAIGAFSQRVTHGLRWRVKAACALTPLLNRAAVLAAQCCALAIKGLPAEC